jgi:copper homeostasis protein CutC
MAGSGIAEATAAPVVRRTGVREPHFSARTSTPDLPLTARIARIARIMTAAGLPREASRHANHRWQAATAVANADRSGTFVQDTPPRTGNAGSRS